MARGSELALWGLLISASITDLRFGKIPNRLTFPFIILGLIFQTVTLGTAGLTQSGLAVGAAFALFFPLFAMGAFAAGDVKLLMAIASFLSVPLIIRIGILSILIGAAVGLFLLLAQKGSPAALASIRSHLRLAKPHTVGLRMPFAPAVFCAFILSQIGEYRAWF